MNQSSKQLTPVRFLGTLMLPPMLQLPYGPLLIGIVGENPEVQITKTARAFTLQSPQERK